MNVQRSTELQFREISRSKHNLTFLYDFNGIIFTTTMWYPTVDFFHLEEKYTKGVMQKLYAHIFLFHGLKLQSLLPETMNIGPIAPFWNHRLQELWETSTLGCLGQWRQETNNMSYRGARSMSAPQVSQIGKPVKLNNDSGRLLVGNGGGKDSLLMLRMLDESDVKFDTFGINFHTAADPDHQFCLSENILQNFVNKPNINHRQYIVETFLNSPAASLHGVAGLSIPHIRDDEDTPNGHGIFGLLPVMLQYGYTDLCFGNEWSAESENLEVAGERVNHAWSKTIECEEIYERYIRAEFILNFSVFSFLKPLSDVLIYRLFNNIAKEGDIRRAYSCNLKPPWCGECPKCAYVWLSYLAYLYPKFKKELAHIFNGINPFNHPSLVQHYRQLMGVEGIKPYECVGEIDEVKLAFELCVINGFSGEAIDIYTSECRLDESEFHELIQKYSRSQIYNRLPRELENILSCNMNKISSLI